MKTFIETFIDVSIGGALALLLFWLKVRYWEKKKIKGYVPKAVRQDLKQSAIIYSIIAIIGYIIFLIAKK